MGWGGMVAESHADADTLIVEVECGGCLDLELSTDENCVELSARYVVIEGVQSQHDASHWTGCKLSKRDASHWTGYKPRWPQQPPPRVTGAIRCLLKTCPKLEFLDMRCCEYAVDWTGLGAADSLRHIEISEFEDLTSRITFPRNCVVDLHGLVTHYRRDPNAVLAFLQNALAECTKWAWNIGYYDHVHVSMLATLKALKHQYVSREGCDKEHLDMTMHVTPNPPSKSELD